MGITIKKPYREGNHVDIYFSNYQVRGEYLWTTMSFKGTPVPVRHLYIDRNSKPIPLSEMEAICLVWKHPEAELLTVDNGRIIVVYDYSKGGALKAVYQRLGSRNPKLVYRDRKIKFKRFPKI